jgi:hypothetical protein
MARTGQPFQKWFELLIWQHWRAGVVLHERIQAQITIFVAGIGELVDKNVTLGPDMASLQVSAGAT